MGGLCVCSGPSRHAIGAGKTVFGISGVDAEDTCAPGMCAQIVVEEATAVSPQLTVGVRMAQGVLLAASGISKCDAGV